MSAGLRWSWVALSILFVGALAYGTLSDDGPATDAERVRDLSERIACPQCSGQSVAESDVTVARVIRSDIADRVDAGQSDEEIVAALKDNFGDDIDLNPSATGLTGIVWVVPVAAMIGGFALVVAMFQRWRPAGAGDATPTVGVATPTVGVATTPGGGGPGTTATESSVGRRGADGRRGRRWVAPVVVTAILAVAAGFGVARFAGTRSAGEGLTGDVRTGSRALLVDAQQAMSAGEHERAIEIYDEVLEIDPSSVEATAYRAWNVYLTGDVDAAADGLDEAVVLDDTYPDALAFRGILRVRNGQERAGLDDLVALDALDPPEGVSGFIVPTALDAAEALLESRDIEGVLEAYTLVIRREPANVVALTARGSLYAQADLFEPALADLDAAVAADPESPYALAYRASVRARSGDRAGAEADLDAFDALVDPPADASGVAEEARAELAG